MGQKITFIGFCWNGDIVEVESTGKFSIKVKRRVPDAKITKVEVKNEPKRLGQRKDS